MISSFSAIFATETEAPLTLEYEKDRQASPSHVPSNVTKLQLRTGGDGDHAVEQWGLQVRSSEFRCSVCKKCSWSAAAAKEKEALVFEDILSVVSCSHHQLRYGDLMTPCQSVTPWHRSACRLTPGTSRAVQLRFPDNWDAIARGSVVAGRPGPASAPERFCSSHTASDVLSTVPSA